MRYSGELNSVVVVVLHTMQDEEEEFNLGERWRDDLWGLDVFVSKQLRFDFFSEEQEEVSQRFLS